MFEINHNLLNSLYSDDIIYHYTKASTAIDYILYNQQLRFSNSLSSSDPIESRKASRSIVYNGEQANRKQTVKEVEEVNLLDSFIENLETTFLQICFCKNSMNDDIDSIPRFKGYEESLGFTKLRMWDQYADRYSGVCIAFSKDKLLELNKSLDIYSKDIEYCNFQDIWKKKIGDIQGNHLINVGLDSYKEQIKKKIIDSWFCKHIDYSGENEFRIGALFNKEKCTAEISRNEIVSNQTMLNIKDCIKAIFVSSFANDKQKNELLKYANSLNVDLIEIKWNYDSIEAIDYKRDIEFYESLTNSKK